MLGDALQPPMANGEVLFDEPWHGRVFGMAVALHEKGVFDWQEFQASLINVVGAWDREADAADPYEYYVHFQNALNQLLVSKGLLSGRAVKDRAGQLAARPHGHDHHHDH